jgi:hypothetical protein
MAKQTKASPKQIQAIYRIGQAGNGWDASTVDARTREVYGVAPSDLSKQGATQWLMLIRFADQDAA